LRAGEEHLGSELGSLLLQLPGVLVHIVARRGVADEVTLGASGSTIDDTLSRLMSDDDNSTGYVLFSIIRLLRHQYFPARTCLRVSLSCIFPWGNCQAFESLARFTMRKSD
jgi:hypothetical protein